mmetsp:Transcript_10028/g.31160  ORF Transcript_10028/g.31160 Transcript_10028/m.31160 type:complete len:231 (+) Transcript_10028:43-735(+)
MTAPPGRMSDGGGHHVEGGGEHRVDDVGAAAEAAHEGAEEALGKDADAEPEGSSPPLSQAVPYPQAKHAGEYEHTRQHRGHRAGNWQLFGRILTGLLMGSSRTMSRPLLSSRPSTMPSRSFRCCALERPKMRTARPTATSESSVKGSGGPGRSGEPWAGGGQASSTRSRASECSSRALRVSNWATKESESLPAAPSTADRAAVVEACATEGPRSEATCRSTRCSSSLVGH